MTAKWLSWLIGIIIAGGLGWWAVANFTNLPGEAVADLGREHWDRAKLETFVYNSNPPTSGPHDPEWIRPGVYNAPQDKYKLIHSLEHGYVVAHYNCTTSNPKSQIPSHKEYSIFNIQYSINASAHEDEGDLDNDSAIPSAAPRPNCSLGQTLADWAKKIGLKRIIIQPNPEIDKPIVLVAWGRILKLDAWNEADATRFAKAYHNKGPERTRE